MTNSILVHVINPSPIMMSAPASLSPSDFRFVFSADIGLAYVVQASSNLFDWNSIATNIAAANPVVFTDTNAVGGGTFYRVGRLPNP